MFRAHLWNLAPLLVSISWRCSTQFNLKVREPTQDDRRGRGVCCSVHRQNNTIWQGEEKNLKN